MPPFSGCWEYFPRPRDIIPAVALILWAYYVCQFDTDMDNTTVTKEKFVSIATICLDDPTATKDYNLPDTKDTLVLKFPGDDSDLAMMKVENYIESIEVLDDRNQITIFSELGSVHYDKTSTRTSLETVVAQRYPKTPCFAVGIPIQNINVIMSLNVRLKKGIYELNDGPTGDLSMTQSINGLLY